MGLSANFGNGGRFPQHSFKGCSQRKDHIGRFPILADNYAIWQGDDAHVDSISHAARPMAERFSTRLISWPWSPPALSKFAARRVPLAPPPMIVILIIKASCDLQYPKSHQADLHAVSWSKWKRRSFGFRPRDDYVIGAG